MEYDSHRSGRCVDLSREGTGSFFWFSGVSWRLGLRARDCRSVGLGFPEVGSARGR